MHCDVMRRMDGCMHVCVYVWVYVGRYVCINVMECDVCMCACMFGMYVCTRACNVCMYAWVHVCVYVYMGACMCVCMSK